MLYIGQPSAERICAKIANKLKLGEEEVKYFLIHKSYKLEFDDDVVHMMQDTVEWEMVVERQARYNSDSAVDCSTPPCTRRPEQCATDLYVEAWYERMSISL